MSENFFKNSLDSSSFSIKQLVVCVVTVANLYAVTELLFLLLLALLNH